MGGNDPEKNDICSKHVPTSPLGRCLLNNIEPQLSISFCTVLPRVSSIEKTAYNMRVHSLYTILSHFREGVGVFGLWERVMDPHS